MRLRIRTRTRRGFNRCRDCDRRLSREQTESDADNTDINRFKWIVRLAKKNVFWYFTFCLNGHAHFCLSLSNVHWLLYNVWMWCILINLLLIIYFFCYVKDIMTSNTIIISHVRTSADRMLNSLHSSAFQKMLLLTVCPLCNADDNE